MRSCVPGFRRLAASAACILFLAQGCSRFTTHAAREYVYVWPKEAYLRDRVAVVSNRVAEVANGQRLEVVEEGHRFLRVKTDRGELGWIEDRGVIDQKVYDEFVQLAKDHAHDPVVGTAVLLDDYWLRDAPGRQSDRFYLLPENDRLQLLARASVPKPEVPQARPVPAEKPAKGASPAAPAAPPPPAMEDYWLVRDKDGHVGWVRARTLEEDVPDAIAGLGEGQKIVGAYVLRTVNDPDANVPGGQVPEYVCVLSAWKDGLPYDFDQVRVFTWNVRKHRYETAYRERNIVGFLPVTISQQTFGREQEPVFSFRVASGDSVALDPATGMVKPGETQTESYHMEGVIVRRIGNPPPAAGVARNPADGRDKAHKRRRG
jgi:SH3-like domain-containing protein